MHDREIELKDLIKNCKNELANLECDFTAQTWLEIQLQEYKKELKQIRKANKPT